MTEHKDPKEPKLDRKFFYKPTFFNICKYQSYKYVDISQILDVFRKYFVIKCGEKKIGLFLSCLRHNAIKREYLFNSVV